MQDSQAPRSQSQDQWSFRFMSKNWCARMTESPDNDARLRSLEHMVCVRPHILAAISTYAGPFETWRASRCHDHEVWRRSDFRALQRFKKRFMDEKRVDWVFVGMCHRTASDVGQRDRRRLGDVPVTSPTFCQLLTDGFHHPLASVHLLTVYRRGRQVIHTGPECRIVPFERVFRLLHDTVSSERQSGFCVLSILFGRTVRANSWAVGRARLASLDSNYPEDSCAGLRTECRHTKPISPFSTPDLLKCGIGFWSPISTRSRPCQMSFSSCHQTRTFRS